MVEEQPPTIVLPPVNLSAMLAAQKPKQSSLPSTAVVDFAQIPPNTPAPVLPVVDFSKPPPNFRLPDLSRPPPIISSTAKTETVIPVQNVPYVPPPISKPIISEPKYKYNEKDEAAINSAWEKLNVDDDVRYYCVNKTVLKAFGFQTLDLASLFETRPTSSLTQKNDDEKHNNKEKRSKGGSNSHERSRRSDHRSRSPHKKRKSSKDHSSSSRKRSKEHTHRHKSDEKEDRKKDKEKSKKEEKRKRDTNDNVRDYEKQRDRLDEKDVKSTKHLNEREKPDKEMPTKVTPVKHEKIHVAKGLNLFTNS